VSQIASCHRQVDLLLGTETDALSECTLQLPLLYKRVAAHKTLNGLRGLRAEKGLVTALFSKISIRMKGAVRVPAYAISSHKGAEQGTRICSLTSNALTHSFI